ncbi:MAG: DUF4386 domain-containing protein [Thermoplasmata archaeon]|nr:DUF4386 domain-containing protein [Thermoplasmata archaeon]
MDPHRKTAMIVGVLFIVATVAGMMAAVFTGPILDDPDYLANTSANENEVILGALLMLIMGVAVVSIAFMIFPILKKVNEGLALGYVCLRTLECVVFVVGVMSLLSLLTLSQEYVAAEAPDATSFETQGAILLAQLDWSSIPADIVFGLGCLMVYYLLYQSKLVPRPLSVWGFIGGIFMLAAAVLGAFGVIGALDTPSILLNLPIAVLEMALAVWLIVKGFNPSAIASLSARVSEGPN